MEVAATGVPDGWVVVESPRSVAPTSSEKPSTTTGLGMTAAAKAVPVTARLAVEAATNPNVPRMMSTVGQIAGGVEGAIKGGPLGAAGGAWTGGKAGYFTGKLAQRLGVPVASLMDRVAPYAQTLATLGGAAGVGDLAQMAEPTRKDIGFLGAGASLPDLDVLTKAVEKGANPGQAAAQIANGDPKRFGALMTAYMQSRQVK